MREAMRLGCDVIGGIPHYEWTREDGVEEVHFLFDLARETGAPIDLHCDETDDEQSRFLEVVAARTMRDGMQGRVVAGHTTAMGSYNDAYAFKLLQILKRAGVTIVANPLDNIVLQGRFDTYPKRRGMTRVKELDAAGVNVACGHDSIMDPVVPARARLDARRPVDARPRRPDDRPDRAVPGLRDGHHEPGPGGRVQYGVEEGLPANFVSSTARTRRRRSGCGRRRAGSSAGAGSWPRRSRHGAWSTTTGASSRSRSQAGDQAGRRPVGGPEPRDADARRKGAAAEWRPIRCASRGCPPARATSRSKATAWTRSRSRPATGRSAGCSRSGSRPNLVPAAFFIGTLVTLDFLKLGFSTSILAIIVGNVVGSALVGAPGDDGPEDRAWPRCRWPACRSASRSSCRAC